jgi:hypothetical protein
MLKPSTARKVVTSSKLLRRLAQKGLIQEPDVHFALPSMRKWGGKRGHCFVEIPAGRPDQFDFEGSHYETAEKEGQFILYQHVIATNNRNAKSHPA